MATKEEIIYALRCTSKAGCICDKHDKCPYFQWDKIPDEFVGSLYDECEIRMIDGKPHVEGCDLDRIGMDAAEWMEGH